VTTPTPSPAPRDARRDHDDALRLPIAETFVSIQGEGALTGTPSLFIRLSGCNLRCRWCDTPYASWEPEGPQRMVDELLEEARLFVEGTQARGHGGTKGADQAAPGPTGSIRHAVLTGGEPMIFKPLSRLCAGLRGLGMHITIETAGTVFRPPQDTPCDLMSISPKLANSTPLRGDPRDPGGRWRRIHEHRRFDPETLQALIDAYPDRQLKFVVTGPEDLPEVEHLLGQLKGFRPDQVMLMPEGTQPPPAGSTAWIARACLERGWRYCHRIHIDLFGNTRGT
jgi:7-carboxy-7-deazaguanine synthase